MEPPAPSPIPIPYPTLRTTLAAAGPEEIVRFLRAMPTRDPIAIIPIRDGRARPAPAARDIAAWGEAWGFGTTTRSDGSVHVTAGVAVTRRGDGIDAVDALFAGDALRLHPVDVSGVVSKYIGETEKNLRRLFDAAEHGGAILFFDEADALFGKRSSADDKHDPDVARLLAECRAHVRAADGPIVRVIERKWHKPR